MSRLRSSSKPITILVVVVLAAALVLGARGLFGAGTKEYTLVFSQTKGLYVGDDVSVLGVKVGKITEVSPKPDKVMVTVEVEGDRKIPADAKAVLVAPSLVAVRRVELAPIYKGGAALEDGATIPISRTAIPVEWDEVKSQLVRLTEALGPEGANKNGALSDFLKVSEKNLAGNGATMNRTISSLADAMETLNEGGGDLFATVRNLDVFTKALAQSDAEVVAFNQRLARVSRQLDGEGDELQQALADLAVAFPKVDKFLKTNGGQFTKTLSELRRPVKNLADNRQDIADLLQVAPGAISNFYNITDPDIPGLTGSFALSNFNNPAQLICGSIYSAGGKPEDCITALKPLADTLKLGVPPIGLAPLLRNSRDNVEPGPGVEGSSSPGAQASANDLVGLLDGLAGGAQ
ncbi:MAG: mammalian cell entry protein [Aeromicrobium sp.]|nr:mammalian cell entry protein [Aeromicrobium sp.]